MRLASYVRGHHAKQCENSPRAVRPRVFQAAAGLCAQAVCEGGVYFGNAFGVAVLFSSYPPHGVPVARGLLVWSLCFPLLCLVARPWPRVVWGDAPPPSSSSDAISKEPPQSLSSETTTRPPVVSRREIVRTIPARLVQLVVAVVVARHHHGRRSDEAVAAVDGLPTCARLYRSFALVQAGVLGFYFLVLRGLGRSYVEVRVPDRASAEAGCARRVRPSLAIELSATLYRIAEGLIGGFFLASNFAATTRHCE
mmetsp:Transcript_20149/g.80404  ORF Transcript_20149/g.80404 Transcript_20149/m.80404 type:complete len:253 (+) Transcript_20149:296-1054(+)